LFANILKITPLAPFRWTQQNYVQGGSNMTGTDLYKRTHKSVPVIFEPPCTWSCLESRMQDVDTIWRLIIVPLKGWNSSNIG